MRADRYYASVLRETHADIDAAREKGNWTATAALRRRAQDAREQLDAAQAQQAQAEPAVGNPYNDVADGDLVDLICSSVAELPEAVITRLQTAIDLRRGHQPTLTVLPGGAGDDEGTG